MLTENLFNCVCKISYLDQNATYGPLMRQPQPEQWSLWQEGAAWLWRPWQQERTWLRVRRHTDSHRHTCQKERKFRDSFNSFNQTKRSQITRLFTLISTHIETHTALARGNWSHWLAITINNSTLSIISSYSKARCVPRNQLFLHIFKQSNGPTPSEASTKPNNK